jgi:hypothetical protein
MMVLTLVKSMGGANNFIRETYFEKLKPGIRHTGKHILTEQNIYDFSWKTASDIISTPVLYVAEQFVSVPMGMRSGDNSPQDIP